MFAFRARRGMPPSKQLIFAWDCVTLSWCALKNFSTGVRALQVVSIFVLCNDVLLPGTTGDFGKPDLYIPHFASAPRVSLRWWLRGVTTGYGGCKDGHLRPSGHLEKGAFARLIRVVHC